MVSSKGVVIFCLVFLVRECYVLEAPILESVTATDDGGLFVIWKPVNSTLSDAILGYKIIIYEVKEKTERMFKLVNAEQEPGLVKEQTSDEVFETIPSKLAKQMLAEGANTNNLVIDYIKPNALHEIRVLAYTKDQESKMSRSWRVKLLTIGSKIEAFAHRHLDECILTIKRNDISSGIPEIYNNYI